MGAAESKPPRSVSTKRRGGQGLNASARAAEALLAGQISNEPGNGVEASRGIQLPRALRRRRSGDGLRGSLSPTGAGKANDVLQQLVEIPFDAEAFLLARAAPVETLDAETGAVAVNEAGEVVDDSAELDEGTRPYVPTVQAHLRGVNKVCRNADWSKPLQRFITRLQLGTDTLSVIYDADLENVGIQPPEETEAWVEQSEPAKFASHVYRFLCRQSRAATSDRHLYVLYHPDADWHADFYELLQDKPLPDNFLAFSENLDALVAFIKFIRKRLGKRANTAMFHLLIPTSRPMSIRDALEFPDLGDLAIHGETHNGSNYVWLNLPTHETYPRNLLLKHVENTIRPESEWKTTATVGTALGGVSASLVGAAFTLRVKGAPFPSLAVLGIGGVCSTIAARVRGAEYLPLAVLGIGGLCTTIAALQVNRGLSKTVPRVVGGFEPPREPKAETEKEDSAVSEQEETRDDPPKARESPAKSRDETRFREEARIKEDARPRDDVAPKEDPVRSKDEQPKLKDDSDAQSILSKTSKSSSSKKHRKSERKRSHK
ncbi:hypothetical protein F66182_7638 [Fusarium sp. NRRL 66182]|nr:hypothetical protein F66182_7638 [Fusarium sp. NRRL 66182]